MGTRKIFQATWFINEPELYRMIFQSRKSAAKKIKCWVFHNVFEKTVCVAVIKSIQKMGKKYHRAGNFENSTSSTASNFSRENFSEENMLSQNSQDVC